MKNGGSVESRLGSQFRYYLLVSEGSSMPCARAALAVATLLVFVTASTSSGEARQVTSVMRKSTELAKPENADWRRLKGGEILVDAVDQGSTRYVVARILIEDTPHNVWRVLTNPFEFEGKISPRMKDVEILVDASTRSVMKCKVEIFPPIIPFISYTVESDYKPFEQVLFKRVDGSLKDFRGGWYLAPRESGASTEVTYQMFVDPGMPVPQWIIRKAMRMELPRTLNALRDRIKGSDTAIGAEPLRTILAVGEISPIVQLAGPVQAGGTVRSPKPAEKPKPLVVKPRQVSSSALPEL
jgi:hypothetical protein